MVGPKNTHRKTQPTRRSDDDWVWQSNDQTDHAGECELCLSQTNTSIEYGMRVCPVCDDELLP